MYDHVMRKGQIFGKNAQIIKGPSGWFTFGIIQAQRMTAITESI